MTKLEWQVLGVTYYRLGLSAGIRAILAKSLLYFTMPPTTHRLHCGTRRIASSPILGRALTLLAILHCAFHLAVFFPRNWSRADRERDVVNYYIGARAALEGHKLYHPPSNFGPDSTHFHYIYLPPFAALVSPLGHLDFPTFARAWSVLLWAGFWIYAWCLAVLAVGPRARWRHVLIAGLAIGVLRGSIESLALGQIDSVLWALFGLGLVGIAPGVSLALGAATKMFLGWPLLVTIRNEGKGVLAQAVATSLALFVLGGLVCGFDSYRAWSREIAPMLEQGTFNPSNYSLSMAGLRLARVAGWNYEGGPLGVWPRLWLSAMSFAGSTAMWWATRRCRPAMQSALVGVAAVACAPTCWSTYLPLALAPVALWWRQIAGEEGASTCGAQSEARCHAKPRHR